MISMHNLLLVVSSKHFIIVIISQILQSSTVHNYNIKEISIVVLIILAGASCLMTLTMALRSEVLLLLF